MSISLVFRLAEDSFWRFRGDSKLVFFGGEGDPTLLLLLLLLLSKLSFSIKRRALVEGCICFIGVFISVGLGGLKKLERKILRDDLQKKKPLDFSV